MPASPIRFPNESKAYRAARNKLLRAERDLLHRTEKVAALRQKLPMGGVVADYVFDEGKKKVKLSQLFEPGHETLVLYGFMYGPKMKQPCPMCTSFLDAFEGTVRHLSQRVSVAVVAKSPYDRIKKFADGRGWKNMRLLSSANCDYQRDYFAETPDGGQMPMMNVFAKRGRKVHHFWGSELLYSPDPGRDARHIDSMWPLWNVFDITPGGRHPTWYPSLKY